MWKAMFQTVFSVVALPKVMLMSSVKEVQNNFAEQRDKILPKPDLEKYDRIAKHQNESIKHLRQCLLDMSTTAPTHDKQRLVNYLYPIEDLVTESQRLLDERTNQPLFDPGEVSYGPKVSNTYSDNPNFSSFKGNKEGKSDDVERGLSTADADPTAPDQDDPSDGNCSDTDGRKDRE